MTLICQVKNTAVGSVTYKPYEHMSPSSSRFVLSWGRVIRREFVLSVNERMSMQHVATRAWEFPVKYVSGVFEYDHVIS